MKVRWTENSLRLRVTPLELTAISGGDMVPAEVTFPGGLQWRVSIQPAPETRLASDGANAVIFLSPDDRRRLAAPETEGVYFQTAEGMRYFVEKDFPCAHPRAAEALETPTETFEAPSGFERRKHEGMQEGNLDGE